jgi:dihydrodipicolinate synthase/N-acetylneuraminate lyase
MARYSSGQAKSWAKENMHGHWTTTITPFLPDGEVDEAGIAKNVENILRLGTQGIGITLGLPAGPVRSPLLPLTDEEKGRLGRGLIEARRAAGLKPPPVAL